MDLSFLVYFPLSNLKLYLILVFVMFFYCSIKALAKEDTNFVSGTQKKVSDFVQKHFVSATNVSQFAESKKHHGQQCVRNNVSSFTRAFRSRKIINMHNGRVSVELGQGKSLLFKLSR